MQERSTDWLPPMCACTRDLTHPDHRPNPQPRYVPWLGIEPMTLCLPDDTPPNWATLARAGRPAVGTLVGKGHYMQTADWPHPPPLSILTLAAPVNCTPQTPRNLNHSPSPAPQRHCLPCLSAFEHAVPNSWKPLRQALPVSFAFYSSFKPQLTCHHLSE